MGVALSRYRSALDALFARTTGSSKLGLERTEALLAAAGDPHRALRCFHVAGTNGKGSVCATLDTLLSGAGYRVGRYTSPHLVDFRERVLIGGKPISEDAVVDWIVRRERDVDRIGATFFEATTVLALEQFLAEDVDIAVIETGLGGRLDSTNVVHPLVAVVTTIGIDHVEYLGGTREQIAREKAGIFKAGAPAVIGERDPAIAELLASIARERGAAGVFRVGTGWEPRNIRVGRDETRFELQTSSTLRELSTSLVGEHQAWNAATALLALQAAGPEWGAVASAADRYLPLVSLPGRFHRVGSRIFDVAHNPDGAAVLAQSVRHARVPGPVTTLLAVLSDKDWRGMMTALAPVTDRFVLTTAPTAPENRRWEPREALAFARSQGWTADVEPDFDHAIAAAAAGAGTTLVTGSFHTVGDAMARLQVDPLAG